MSLNLHHIVSSLILLVVFFAVTGTMASAGDCEASGGTCRPGWISGCGSVPETPDPNNFCPPDTRGSLVCCKLPQSTNPCTTNGGLCFNNIYASVPGEPVCGYITAVPTADSCGASNQTCCMPPPNVGDACNSATGTCQLLSVCPGAVGSSDCRGGAKCCIPMGSITITACSIPVGASSCTVTVDWNSTNTLNPDMRQDGSQIATSANGRVTPLLDRGQHQFQLLDGSIQLDSKFTQIDCQSGLIWEFSSNTCVTPPPPPTGSISATPPTCDIGAAGTNCDVKIDWSSQNATNLKMKKDGVEINPMPASGAPLNIAHGSYTISLYDGATLLSQVSIAANCSAGLGLVWDGSACSFPPGLASGTITVTSITPPTTSTTCTIATGDSTCDVTVSWTSNVTTSLDVKEKNVIFSAAVSSTGETRSIGNGTTTYTLSVPAGTAFASAQATASCVAGSGWDTATSTCVVTPPATCPVACEPRNPGCGGLTREDTSKTCTNPASEICCVATTPATCPVACEPRNPGCGGLTREDTSKICTNPASEICCVATTPATCPVACTPSTPGNPKCGPLTTEDTSKTCTNSNEVCCVASTPAACISLTGGVCARITDGCIAPLTPDRSGATCSGGQMCCVPAGGGTGTPVNPGFISWGNPLKWTTFQEVISAVLSSLQGLLITLALIMIVIGGIIYITSAGDEGRMTTAKNTVFAALIGLALGVAAPMFFREIGTLLDWRQANIPTGFGTTKTLIQVLSGVLNFLLSIVGVAALIVLVIGGFMYLTAAGDESRIDTGKGMVKYALIGITVALAALVLVRQVANFFN